jgi:hypothetical protein
MMEGLKMGIYLKDIIEGTCRKSVQDENGKNISDTYLKKTGDSKDNTASFTSADSLTPAAWADVPVLATGEKHSSILNKISTMFRNIRWLYKMLGTTNIASIGGGTLTGAISKLNTDLQGMDGIKYIDFGAYDGSKKTLDDVVKEILNNFPLSRNDTYIGYFVMGPMYRIIIQPFQERTHASAIVFSYATKGVVFYTKIVNNVKKYTTNWDETTI